MSIPPGKKLAMDLVAAFLHATLLCCRLPVPKRHCDVNTRWIRIKAKYLDHWVLDGKFAAHKPCAIFNHPWNEVSRRMEENTRLRMICRGKVLIDERRLGDVVDEDNHPCPELKIHYVLQLHGGGVKQQKPDSVTTTKNDLARLFLQIGCELHQTTQAVENLIKMNGIAAIKHAMRQKAAASKLGQLERLAECCGVKLPPHNVAELKRNHANQARQQKQKIRTQLIDVNDYKLAPGTFKNQDGTSCQVLESIKHAANGVMLRSPQQAEAWLQHTTRISQDELGLLILG